MIGLFVLISMILFAMLFCFLVKRRSFQYIISLFVSIFHLVFSFTLFTGLYTPDFHVFLSMDSLSKLFLLVLSNVYFWVVLVSFFYLKRSDVTTPGTGKKYYFLLLNFYLLANTVAILSNNFGLYWVAAEVTTLSVAPLIYFYRNKDAWNAMWKYLFLVSVGIAFAFIGILFLSLAANGTSLEGEQLFFSVFVDGAKELNPVWLKASFIFIFVGFSTKIGLSPLHSADVEATSNSPGPIAGLMSGSLRITALIGVMRIFQIVNHSTTHEFARIILIIGGICSMAVAFVYMFNVKNYKRLLAYSSVEHMGLITLSIGVGGLAFLGAMYHVIYNSITKVILFFSAGNIHQNYKSREVGKVSSVLKLLPITGWILILAFMAISAIPPFGLFFSELTIFQGLLFSDKPYLLVLTMILLIFIFINMGRVLFRMLYHKEEGVVIKMDREKLNIIHLASIVLLILLVVIAVSSPDILRNNIDDITKDFGINL